MSNIKLLYGTTNKAKITVMENAVGDLGIELISLNDLNCELPVIVENGKTPLENAEIKARAYYETPDEPQQKPAEKMIRTSGW